MDSSCNKDSSATPQNDNNFQYDDNHRHVEQSETSTWNLNSSHAVRHNTNTMLQNDTNVMLRAMPKTSFLESSLFKILIKCFA